MLLTGYIGPESERFRRIWHGHTASLRSEGVHVRIWELI